MAVQAEKVRQTFWCFSSSGHNMAPKHVGSRNQKMFDDATAFNKKLNTCEKRIKQLKAATDGILEATDMILSGSQPGMWEKDSAGKPAIMPGSDAGIIAAGQLQRTNSLELKATVLEPLAEWQAEYTRLKGRLAEEQHESLLLDIRRRKYYKKSRQHLKDSVLKADTEVMAMPEDSELQAARSQFEKVEGEIHNELVALAQKARETELYLSRCLRLEADALVKASEKIHPTELAPALAAATGNAAEIVPMKTGN